jgi:coenzyme F420 hydrogenase subunit beta
MIKTKGNLMDLEAEVIYNGLCCYCGTCGAFCTEYISYEDELPKTKKKCYEICGACYEFCPRTFLAPLELDRALFGAVRTDNLLGYYQGDLLSARATDKAVLAHSQDGGVVSSLLIFLLEQGEIDAAVVTKRSEEAAWKPEPFIARTKEEILAAAGSKYTQCPTVIGLAAALEAGYQQIAFAGLPCHIEGVRKVQVSQHFEVGAERVKFLIGLFCTETFDTAQLQKTLEELGTSIEEVEKFNIRKGSFIVQTKAGEKLRMPIRTMRTYAREACNYCYDFAAEFADVSVGSIGSEDGWSTVIVRSDAGKALVARAAKAGYLEAKKLSEEQLAAVRNLASFKKRENLKRLYEKSEPVRLSHLLVEPEQLEQFLCGD